MLLTVSSFIIKLLGFLIRICLTNLIGAEGAGLYQLIVSVYALGASAAVSGIGVAVSALVGANPKESASIVKTAVIISTATGFFAFSVCFFKTDLICALIGDERALTPLKIISFCFPFTALFAALGGYFNGKCDVAYPIAGQIIEQAVRIGIIFIFAAPAAKIGIGEACAVAAAGITAAEAVSAVYLAVIFYRKRPYMSYFRFRPGMIASVSVPAALSGWIGSALHTAESVIIPARFAVSGIPHYKAVAGLGIVKGMVMPLVVLPNILITALATVALPSVSYAREHNRMFKIKHSASQLMRVCFTGGFFSAVIFFCFGDELCLSVFHNREAGALLRLTGFVSPFLYVNILSASILVGLGLQRKSLLIGSLEGIIKIILLYLLIPKYGIYGCVIPTLAGGLFSCLLNIGAISSRLGKPVFPLKTALVPALGCALSCFSGTLSKGIAAILVPPAVYFITLVAFKAVGLSDLYGFKKNIS